MNREDFTRFEQETRGVADPVQIPEGEVIPPGQTEGGGELPIDDFATGFLTDEVVAEIFAMPGAIMARKTDHEWWKPDEEEKCLLGKTIGPGVRYLVQRYLSGAAGPFALMGAGLGIVYGPKALREHMEQKAEKERRSKNPSGDPRAAPNESQSNPPIPFRSPQNSTAKSAAYSETVDTGNPPNSGDFGVLSREL